jgi:hypothetical protein
VRWRQAAAAHAQLRVRQGRLLQWTRQQLLLERADVPKRR